MEFLLLICRNTSICQWLLASEHRKRMRRVDWISPFSQGSFTDTDTGVWCQHLPPDFSCLFPRAVSLGDRLPLAAIIAFLWVGFLTNQLLYGASLFWSVFHMSGPVADSGEFKLRWLKREREGWNNRVIFHCLFRLVYPCFHSPLGLTWFSVGLDRLGQEVCEPFSKEESVCPQKTCKLELYPLWVTKSEDNPTIVQTPYFNVRIPEIQRG